MQNIVTAIYFQLEKLDNFTISTEMNNNFIKAINDWVVRNILTPIHPFHPDIYNKLLPVQAKLNVKRTIVIA